MALKIAREDNFLDLSDALDTQENWGIEETIQSVHNGSIRVKHKAKFATLCMDWCNGSKSRQYFWVLKNAFESNYPNTCYCIPYVSVYVNSFINFISSYRFPLTYLLTL